MKSELSQQPEQTEAMGHPAWVRICHWLVASSFLALTFSGYVILMCHPRLYWGEVGNDLTPALLELPISENHQHGKWGEMTPLTEDPAGPVSSIREAVIFNENAWARSLHFLAAWILVVGGVIYLLAGILTGHFRRRLWPSELSLGPFWQEVIDHVRLRVPPATGGPQYGLLQKCAYCIVVLVAMPLIVLTGLAMSPTLTAAIPVLGSLFGGFQSARTIHFVAAVALVMFLLVHVVMVVKSGFRSQMRTMTFWRKS